MKYLIIAILISIGTGVGVYKVMKERAAEAAALEASRPKPPAPPPREPTQAPEREPEPERELEPPTLPTLPDHESPPHEPLARGTVCDEVSCVLDNYTGHCCEKFRRGRRSADDKPESLDRVMISDGIAKVKRQIMACGQITDATGQVKVRVKVEATGKVSTVSVAEAPDDELGQCVARVIKNASFGETETGGSFSYPFVF